MCSTALGSKLAHTTDLQNDLLVEIFVGGLPKDIMMGLEVWRSVLSDVMTKLLVPVPGKLDGDRHSLGLLGHLIPPHSLSLSDHHPRLQTQGHMIRVPGFALSVRGRDILPPVWVKVQNCGKFGHVTKRWRGGPPARPLGHIRAMAPETGATSPVIGAKKNTLLLVLGELAHRTHKGPQHQPQDVQKMVLQAHQPWPQEGWRPWQVPWTRTWMILTTNVDDLARDNDKGEFTTFPWVMYSKWV